MFFSETCGWDVFAEELDLETAADKASGRQRQACSVGGSDKARCGWMWQISMTHY